MSRAIDARATHAPQRASLLHNVGAMYALQIANYAIPLVTLPYLIRVLGADGYGLMAMAYAVVFFMVLFVDAGTNTLAIRRLARRDIGQTRISAIYAATQLIKLVLCAAMYVLLVVLTRLVPSVADSASIYFATFPIVLGSLLFPTWLFQGLQVMHFTTVCSVGGRLLATAAIFALVRDSGDLVVAALLQASATALAGLLALPFVFRRIGVSLFVPARHLLGELRHTLVEARAFAPAEFVTNAMANSGVFVLGLFASDAAVGVYAAVEKVARAGASLFQPLTKSLFPQIAGGWSSGDPRTVVWCRQWTGRILLLAALAAAGLCAVAPFVLETLFGAGWAQHAMLLRVLAAWLVASVAATVVGQFWLLGRGQHGPYALCLLTSSVAQLITGLTAAAHYGATGLVVALVITESLRLALFSAAARRPDRGVMPCAS